MTMTYQNLNKPHLQPSGRLSKKSLWPFQKTWTLLNGYPDNAHSELISTHISGAEVFGSCLSDYLLGKLGCDLHDAR